MTTKDQLTLLEKRILHSYHISIIFGSNPRRINQRSLQALLRKLKEAVSIAENLESGLHHKKTLEEYLENFRRAGI